MAPMLRRRNPQAGDTPRSLARLLKSSAFSRPLMGAAREQNPGRCVRLQDLLGMAAEPHVVSARQDSFTTFARPSQPTETCWSGPLRSWRLSLPRLPVPARRRSDRGFPAGARPQPLRARRAADNLQDGAGGRAGRHDDRELAGACALAGAYRISKLAGMQAVANTVWVASR